MNPPIDRAVAHKKFNRLMSMPDYSDPQSRTDEDDIRRIINAFYDDRAILDKLPEIVGEALGGYHTQHMQDGEGGGLLLVDALSEWPKDEAEGIFYGKEEVALLKDHILGAIMDYREAAEAAKGGAT